MSQKNAKKLRKELRRQIQQAQPRPGSFTLSVPKEWWDNPYISSIWVAAFRVLYAPREELNLGDKTLSLSDVQIVIRYGTLYYEENYLDLIYGDERSHRLYSPNSGLKETPEGIYVLIAIPCSEEDIRGDHGYIQAKINYHAGLLAAIIHENVVYKCVFQQIYNLDGTTASVSNIASVTVLDKPTDISDSRLSLVYSMDKAIEALPEKDRNRVKLSLRWFEAAVHDSGINAFLKYWLAIETLGMPNTSNIKPINEILAREYNLSIEQVRDKFAVGRLQDFRAKIVHDGVMTEVGGNLLIYIAALFVDVLYSRLSFPCEKRAEHVMMLLNFNPAQYLRQIQT